MKPWSTPKLQQVGPRRTSDEGEHPGYQGGPAQRVKAPSLCPAPTLQGKETTRPLHTPTSATLLNAGHEPIFGRGTPPLLGNSRTPWPAESCCPLLGSVAARRSPVSRSIPAAWTRGRSSYSPLRSILCPRPFSLPCTVGETRPSSKAILASGCWSSLSASTALAGSSPKSTVLIMASSVPVIIRAPPAPPTTRTGSPSSTTIVGLIEERGRLPGSGSLGVPGPEKSVSSLLSRKPVPGATTALPKLCSMVQVSDTAFPAASMIERWVVLLSGFSPGSPGP